ncbi:stromal interaction molecule 1-like isoform X2 [Pomacea canaliculata]|uniref:stromal interaction molecule 1-like isoform X2 n=1 Tax=Pomacea canaliculata TaxID=400727 RepID=UPI000D73CD09|nr:stromal interaction molecule 1-like isoform X2 [Pomacea canaliculata]
MKIKSLRIEAFSVVCFLVILVIRNAYGSTADTKKNEDQKVHRPADTTAVKKIETPANGTAKGQSTLNFDCNEKDKECKEDKLGYEAIYSLHRLIDDDHNGNVDQSESDEFLRDELQYTDGFERHSLFHNNDKLISVDDLWRAWKFSEVYNWTVDDVVDWLQKEVDLPQYSAVFMDNSVSGPYLPRLASSSSALVSVLGIKNPVHKQKLALKAMDTVLFGAPPKRHSYMKDLVLVASLIFAVGGCWFAYLHHRYSREQVRKLLVDLESLQKAEEALMDVQRRLEDAETRQADFQSVSSVKQTQNALHEGAGEGTRQIEEELAATLLALHHAENQLEQQWSPPGELQAWLQLTHELELEHYTAKRQAAERQYQSAKESCEKIKKRNKALFGALRMAHSNSLDEIDQRILDARMALEEVKHDLQERLLRWHVMERLCGFPIVSNPGLAALHQTLHGAGGIAGRFPPAVGASVSVDEADEDLPPPAEIPEMAGLPYALIPDNCHIEKEKMGPRRGNRRRTQFSYPPVPIMTTNKSFLRKRAGTGSTGSLSHLARVGVQLTQIPHTDLHNTHPTSHSSAMLLRDGHEMDIASPPSSIAAEPVTFHLGEQLQHAPDRIAATSYTGHHHHTPHTISSRPGVTNASPSQPAPSTSTGSSALYGGVYIGGAVTGERQVLVCSPQPATNGVSAAFLHSKSLNFSDSDDNLSQGTQDSLPQSQSSSALQRGLPSSGQDLDNHTSSLDMDDRSISQGSQKKSSVKKKFKNIFRKTHKQKSV